MLEKTLKSPLDSKEIKPVNSKGNQSCIFTGRTDAEAEAPIFQPPDVKSQFIGKDPNAQKEGRQDEKRVTKDEMIGWHHQLNRHEFEKTSGDGEGQGGLECCNTWDLKESDMTEQLNNNKGESACRWDSGEESICHCRRHERGGFDPWVKKIPWSRK